MADPPLISIVIPARNAAATLAHTLDSLLAQSEGGWEAFIVNDGSTDATAAIIAAYAARDTRFNELEGPGKGVGAARNIGVFAARGKWLHFLDADDWTDPSFFEKMLAALRANPSAVVSYCGYCRIMPGGLVTAPYRMPNLANDPYEDFARGCPVAIHAVLVEREVIVRLGGFDTTLLNCEDWDLWQRVARFPGQWVLVDEGLAYYRTDGTSLSRNVEWLLANSRIILARGFGIDERLAGMPGARTAPPSEARGIPEQAFAYNALWTAGMACGSGDSGKVGAEMLRPFKAAAMETYSIATVIVEGLMVGSRSLPEQLAARWPAYGARLTALMTWLGEIWSDPGAARALQYRVEEMILYSEAYSVPRLFSLTQSVRIDIRNPPATMPPPGVDRIYACLADGDQVSRYISVAALGNFTKRQWLEVIGLFNVLGYRVWRKTGLAADLQLLRRAVLRIGRHPGLLLRRSKYRATLASLTRATIANLAVAADPPGSHAAKLAEIKTWAAEYARKNGAITPVEPLKVFFEDGVDPGNRQGHFESLFETEDPWNYGSAYEQQKYERQLAILPDGPVGKALELGCAEGHFTVQLAPHVGHLLATDISTKALARTQARCAEFKNIEYQVLDFSVGPIPGGMDLIICSETLYYLADEAELRKFAPILVAALRPGGCIVMAHAHAVKDNMARTGFDWDSIYGVDVINRVFSALPELALERSLDTELYRIDRFRRTDGSVDVGAPVIATAPIVPDIEREVARSIVWGGAKMLRTDAKMREHRFHLPILMYHGVSEDGPEKLARYRVTPASFKAQMRWLRANGYYSIGSEQLVAQMASRQPFSGRPVMITFDDGFQDFADNAWPVLVAHDFTAEMFVVTGRAGQTAIWDADKGPPAPLMDPATIARLAAEGALFGSHTATHRPLDGLTAVGLGQELAGSRAMLEQWLGRPPLSFAAPFSITDSRLGWMAKQCGYQIGFGGETGVARLDMNPLDLPRMEVHGERPLEDFIANMEAAL